MRITEAARRLGTSPRMLRYRDTLGLLPGLRPAPGPAGGSAAGPAGGSAAATPHRQFGQEDLDAVALGLAIEHRYDISPAALAFGLRVLAEPPVGAEVAELGRRIGRIPAPAARALDFEQERALRLLSMGRRSAQPAREFPEGARVSGRGGRGGGRSGGMGAAVRSGGPRGPRGR